MFSGVFGNLEMHGKNRSIYWTRLAATANIGTKKIQVIDEVDWVEGDLIVIAPTTYRPHETEVVKIVNLSSDRKTLFINESLKYKHIFWSNSIGSHNVTMAAEVGLLTRNIVIEGADDGNGVLDKQLFGCRVLIGSIQGHQVTNKRRVRVENVEFRHCGQEGWSDYYDPRYNDYIIIIIAIIIVVIVVIVIIIIISITIIITIIIIIIIYQADTIPYITPGIPYHFSTSPPLIPLTSVAAHFTMVTILVLESLGSAVL